MRTQRLLIFIFILALAVGGINPLCGQSLTADFSGTPLSGPVSLQVDFTDLTTGSPSGWAWYFGDEDFSEITWNQVNAGAAWVGRQSHSSVTLPDGSIVILGGFASGGSKSDVWRSTDKGVTWTQQTATAPWGERDRHASVVLPDGSIVLLGGTVGNASQNDVWRSTDKGVTWTQMTASAAWQERFDLGCVVLSDGTILVMGGNLDDFPWYLKDIWKSTDNGATWTLITDNPGWNKRSQFGSVVMPNGKILIMGGYGTSGGWENDVWQSSDNGATWTQVNASAAWTARTNHSVHLIPDGSIFLMLGVADNSVYLSDIWRSGDDGATWSLVSDSLPPGLSGSNCHSTVMLNDGDIILTGGNNDQLPYSNTVWQYSTATSALQNPSHVYTSPDDYQVTLQAWSATEVSTERKAGYVSTGEADECSRKSLLLNGVDEYVELNPFWATSPESLSVEAWVYPTSGADEVILYHGEKGEFSLAITSNTIKMRINTVTTGWLEVEMSGVAINEWMHVCGTWNKGDKLCLYVNGVLQDQIIVPDEFLADPGTGFGHCLGAYNAASGWYNGELDEIRIWSKALNQDEIRTSMHTMQSNTEAGLQYYWPVISESGTTLYEIASGENHGMLQNMDNSAWVSSGAPLGGGSTALNSINSTGTHVFSDQHLEMEFVEKTGTDTIVVSHINCAPNVLPAAGEVLTTDQYWIVNHYGQGSFNTNLTFTGVSGLTADDEAIPLQIVLFSRESNSDESWTAMTSAGQVDAANNTVTFTGITGFSQFSIGRMGTRKVYVKHDATGNNDGTSWTDAYTSLQTSLDNAVARDVIWVAAGTYTPTYDYGLGIGTRGNHFRMLDNVHIYGGFAGNEPEDYNLSLRDFETNTTYLSADINGDDNYTGASWTGTSENGYHVLYHPAGLNLTNAARLDGFTLSGGNANAGSEPHHSGGGIYNKENSPVFANLKVENNFANNGGGGIFLEESHSVIIGQSSFHNNETRTAASGFSGAGGGMYCSNSDPEITNSSFSQNTSYYGGGISSSGNSSPSFTNLLVTNNEGAHGGGMYLSGDPEKIVNLTIARNSASSGGGIYASNTEAEFNNTIIYENTATSSGHQFAVISADIALNYSCYSNETGDIALSGSNPGFNADINSITDDPLFLDALNNDYRIFGNSPCADAGDNTYNDLSVDIRGFDRKQDKTTGASGIIDMGAYEYTPGTDKDAPLIWTGNTSADWNTASNWDKNIVPDPDEYVIVPSEPANQPHISSAPEIPSVCQTLTIQSGAVVTIEEGKALTVPGSITNNNGANGLILKSDITGTASLIHYNTDVEATAQRYIPQYLTDATGWHYLSSPVVQQTIRPEFVADPTPHADDDFYKFSEPDYLWINTKVEGGTWNPEFEADFVVGRGYNVAYAENQTKSFEGSLIVGDYTFDGTTTPAITYTAAGGIGWNLMGNPYPSGLDWDLCQRTNIDGAVYVYDGNNGQYVSWNGTVGALSEGIIPPMNGFFIKASENPAFAIPNSARAHTSTNFLKSKDAVPDLLVLQVEGNGFSDKTYIHFNPEATTNFDKVFDAYKLSGIAAAPQLFTKTGDTKLSINVLPYSAEEIAIPLSLTVGQDGEYTLSVAENSLWESVDILLKDLETQISYDLRENTQLSFNMSTANPDRFLLLINGITGLEENQPEDDGIEIYSYGDQVFIKTDAGPGKMQVGVYNLLGQQVHAQTLSVHENSELSVLQIQSTGFYLITVRTEKALATKKVFIR